MTNCHGMQTVVFCFLVVSSTISFSVNGQMMMLGEGITEAVKDPETVVRDWEKMDHMLKYLVKQGTNALMSGLMDSVQEMNISSTCIKQGMQVLTGIRKLETWAVKFIDSSAKGIDGLLVGSRFSYGVYDECLETEAINQRAGKQKGQVMFTGKYCIMRMIPSLPPKRVFKSMDEGLVELNDIYKEGTMLGEMVKYGPSLYLGSMKLGICIPSGCTLEDLNQGIKKLSNLTGLFMDIKKCEVKEEIEFTPLMITVICLYSFVGILVFIGTIIDVFCYYSERTLHATPLRVLLAFSVISNFRKITDTSTASQEFSCLNGMRFLTMTWIVNGHTHLLVFNRLIGEVRKLIPIMEKIEIGFLFRDVCVEIFFFIGAFLVCYISTKHVIINKRKFSLKMFIIHRLWRIYPAYIFVLLFSFLFDLMASGPMANEILHGTVEQCKASWWKNLLFINNYYDMKDECIPYTWYISVDMQLYIGSLIILLPLLKCPKLGITMAVITAVFFTVFSSVYSYLNDYGPTTFYGNPNADITIRWIQEYYVKPYPHIATYMIGLIAGYFLAMNPNLKLSKLVQVSGWTISFACGWVVIFGPYRLIQGKEPAMVETLFINGLQRPAWALCICWMFICCVTGHGGVVNHILSWKMWIPLGRLTYSAYLIHPLVLAAVIALHVYPVTLQRSIVIMIFFSVFVTTYLIAFVGSILFESPFISLEKLLLPKSDRTSKKKQEEHGNQVANVTDISNGKHTDTVDSTSTVLRSYKDIECKY